MAVDDLWTKRGPGGKKVPSARHGRGKRWRVRYTDAAGKGRERLFERKSEADAYDARVRAGVADDARTEQSRLTFREYGERWRLAREVGVALETRRRVESNLRLHLYPTFGGKPVRSIRPTDVLEWLTAMVRADTPKNSIRLYFDVLRSVLNGARADKVIADNVWSPPDPPASATSE